MIESITWLLLIEFIGLLAWPVCFAVFRFLPERGYTLAKSLGLLATGYGVWLLSMLGLPFNIPLCWAVLLGGFVVLDGLLLWRQNRRLVSEISQWLRQHAWLVVIAEIIFIAAYFYLVNLRSYMPDIRDQEKFGDFAFMNSMVVNTRMPPGDPWMSGYPVNYYYFSHFMMAMLTKMTGIIPATAFNLTIPLVFALTGLASFGIVFNMVSLTRKRPGLLVPVVVGLAGLAFICLLGNLDAVRQIFFPRSAHGETGIDSFGFSWWTPSRVIYDYMPSLFGDGSIHYEWRETINEFPMFSFLLADMHPHVMTLPTALLAVATALNIFQMPANSEYSRWRKPEGWLLFSTTALITGSLYFLNTWDYPTYLLLIVGAAFWRAWRVRRIEQRIRRFSGAVWGWTAQSLGLVVVSLLLFLPFHLTFVSLVGDNLVPDPIDKIPVLNVIAKNISFVAWDRTPMLGYFLVFGVFLLPLISLLGLKLSPYLRDPYAYLNGQNEPEVFSTNWSSWLAIAGFGLLVASELGFFILKINPLITIALAVLALPLLLIGLATLALETLSAFRARRPRLEILAATGGLALVLVVSGYLLHFELYGPLIIGGGLTGLILWFENRPLPLPVELEAANDKGTASETGQANTDSFALWLMLLAAVICFGTELILVRDVFNSRFNTLFKFYYQVWLLFGLAAAYSLWRVAAWAWKLTPFEANREPETNESATRPAFPFGRGLAAQLAPRLQLATGMAGASGNLAFSTTLNAPTGDLKNIQPAVAEPVYATDDPEAEEAEEYAHQGLRRPWWRWLWVFGVSILLLGGLVYPIFGPYEKSGHYASRTGLDGSAWLLNGGPTGAGMPADYEAIQWLRARLNDTPNFYGTILEATGGDWVDFGRVSTFSGLPTLLGWQGHEDQWRGGKALARTDTFKCWQVVDTNNIRNLLAQPPLYIFGPKENQPEYQKDEPPCRRGLVETIYSTEEPNLAKNLLKATGVKYVYVGSIETGQSTARSNQPKQYSQAALEKFGQFMKIVYQQNGVTIYGF